jgi:hypothetical protein
MTRVRAPSRTRPAESGSVERIECERVGSILMCIASSRTLTLLLVLSSCRLSSTVLSSTVLSSTVLSSTVAEWALLSE